MRNGFCAYFGPVKLNIQCHDPTTMAYFETLPDFTIKKSNIDMIHVDPEEITVMKKEYSSFYNENCSIAYTEYCLLLYKISNLLPRYNCCLFHGVSFMYKNKVYILTAPSGTGKTTQYKNLKKLYGDQIQIMNGDKPILEVGKRIIVHPSPWFGKEGYRSNKEGELKGIIYLEQGKTDSIEKMNIGQAVLPILSQFLYEEKSREILHCICRIEDQILKKVPVYKLINTASLESTRMIFNTVLEKT